MSWAKTVRFSPEGARVLTISRWDKTAWLWDAATGVEIAILRHEATVKSEAFSPDGVRIVTTTFDHTVRLWNAVNGDEIAILHGDERFVYGAAFSPDGSRIVTASDDRTARLWDAATGAEKARIVLDARVTALAIHDTAIALGDALGRIHVFDLSGSTVQ